MRTVDEAIQFKKLKNWIASFLPMTDYNFHHRVHRVSQSFKFWNNELTETPEDKLYCLEINAKTVEGYFIGNYSIPIVSEDGNFMNKLFRMV